MMGQRSGTKRALRESQAWREIARRVDRLASHEGYLCDQLGYLSGRYPMTPPFVYPVTPRVVWGESVSLRMSARVKSHLDEDGWAYGEEGLWANDDPRLTEYRKARVLAALFLALEAEDEERATRRTARKAQLTGVGAGAGR